MNTITSTPKHLFDVVVDRKTRGVYAIEGREHEGSNGEPKTWWIYMHDALSVTDAVPPADSDAFQPWHKWILRQCWDISFKESNYTKEKWDEIRFSHGLVCTMNCNGKPVYEFRTNDMSYAMAKAQTLIVQMGEHPYNFFSQGEDNGRKIYFYGMPATVQASSCPGEIHIIPDYTDIDRAAWWEQYELRKTPFGGEQDEQWRGMEADTISEHKHYDKINWGCALSDQHINWFRS